ncbi:MAG: SDR family NAD(P)-dependent oxidoreductase [Clostridiales bacterium]|jgi:acyl transferase domain-containing protein/NAD(P)H-dependent flavin oxidoreductase YrpB (nitropropane dioxygenase family)/NAD(P)-dependent dehydrogenase (short-subunit alcohol dehydrogenase family)|nr:SDR family NAD(P)-dependent oxidoreductase [Clostridiales bacterium]
MKRDYINDTRVWIVTPFERPDVKIAAAAAKAGAFPVLHLGRNSDAATAALNEASKRHDAFGVCLADENTRNISLPSQVSKIILPWGMKPPETTNAEIVWQILTVSDALKALAAGAKTLILKGCEGAGLCGADSSFILFQKLIKAGVNAEAELFVQGGAGVHSAAAYIALGAAGVVLDSQIALFPECGLPQARKTVLGKLSGSEIRACAGYNYYVFPGSNESGGISELNELFTLIGAEESDVLPLGQDIVLSVDLAEQYKRLKALVRAIKRAASGHLKQARISDALASGGETAESLGTRYPITQGPMARISDTPEFLRGVADAGALPFLAMGMMTGQEAADSLSRAAEAMQDKPWGVGILGFTYPKTVEEQTKLILETKPPFVLIAGARPGQGKAFESAGIQVLLHAPTPGTMDMHMKDGARSFIFEGRESGGHVGPLFSTVLWEKQIYKILNIVSLYEFRVFFAGGVHDSLSAAFVRVMTGPVSARGVKIGIQCGTAYLYTEEAVKLGAISETYQKLLIESDHTVLLKSASGQETRCVPTSYTEFFNAEKARMESEGLETGEILQKLENLNLGRLRIASKGIERTDGQLIPLPEEERLEKGLYMTGTVTELTKKTSAIAELHEDLSSGSLRLLSDITVPETRSERTSPVDIAVIGMCGIYPKAADLDEFWRNIVFGYDCISEVPKERWPVELFYDPDTKDTDHAVSKWGGFLDKTDFNALEFGITPQSLAAIEPAQLLSLLVTKRALEDAGFTDLSQVDMDDTAVIFGAQGGGELLAAYGSRSGLIRLLGELPKEAEEVLPRLTEDSFPGVLGNVIAGRISNRLNTGGRNYVVDAACSASLAALDLAVAELNDRRSDMVILGGTDFHSGLNEFLMFSSTFALSKKGRCATFDVDADGIALGEGVGAVILKRLEDAERDGNKIYAVVKGTGGSSDGKNLGLTAPSKRGQIRAMEQAYETAGIGPSEVGLVESHGTGTAVGDRIELLALTDVFLEDGARPGSIALSSLKSQIGHTKCAAGVAGLIKMVHCVRHGIFPPTLHLKKPNEVYSKSSPFAFRTEKAGYWHAERRVAALSGFGFGGSNFHALIANYQAERPETLLKAWPSELFIFPGETADEAADLMGKIIEMLNINNKLRLRDIAYSLASNRRGRPVRCAIIAGTRDELLTRIKMALEGVENENIYPLKPVPGKVAFLFPGQGSQRVNMAADLFMVFPKLRRLLDGLPEYERILFPESVFTDEAKKAQTAAMTDTRNTQVLLGVVDLAVAELLRDFGITPDMAAGHSYGELPALCFSGAFDANELPGLSHVRAEAILSAVGEDPGRMAAVFTDAETLEKLLDGETNVWAVNFNAPRQTVVAGTSAGIDAFLEKAEAVGVSASVMNVACAFHSPLVKGADTDFAAALREVGFKAPEFPVWSNTDAGIYTSSADEIKEHLAEHLIKPVRFAEEIIKMSEAGAAVFVEAGPGGALMKLASDILKGKEIATIQTERGGTEGLTFFLHGLAKYISTGRMFNIEKLFEGREAVMLNVEEPIANKKNGIIWNIDGRAATPENGELPSHAWKPVEGVLSLNELKKSFPDISMERIMMSYLDNMNAMIQDQRDVVLGYLGAPETAFGTGGARRRFELPEMFENETPMDMIVEDALPEQAEARELPDILSLTTDELLSIILETVSEKTGYPLEMLDPEMDFEADLSIDSIKKMDIVAGLSEKVKMPEIDAEGMDMMLFEKMISIKKFKDLTEWIEQLAQAAADGTLTAEPAAEFTGAKIVADLSDIKPEKPETGVVRLALSDTARPIEEKDLNSVKGKTFAVTNDGDGLAWQAADSLRNAGADAYIIEDAEDACLTDCDGLILINSSRGTNRYNIFDLFKMLKQADMEKLQRVLVLDDAAAAALEAGNISDPPDGYSGFLKTLIHEYPEKFFRSAAFETIFDPETFAGIVMDELTTTDLIPEIYYRSGERFWTLPKIDTVETGSDEEQRQALDENSVVVVLGGAQGITPHVVARMAKEIPCRYILMGRSSVESEQYPAFGAIDEIRRYLIEQEGMKQPREIEAKAKRIFKSGRIAASVAMIEQAGGKAEYIQADVTDAETFTAALSDIKRRYGAIDGVIHAAGILEDKLFRNKDAESFARVYHTKTLPMKTILSELLPDLKLLVLFSSISAAFGNGGQCDYAAGNSVLNITARILKQQNPGLKVVAVNWGPWRGAGMIDSALEAEFRKKGIMFIDLETGSEFLVRELKYRDESTVLAIASDEETAADLLERVFS